ncbi:MAG: imidazole glycerol phosphate synthase subunit HisH [Firmicutes bacterium]|nr:imidazole glycerol phosphate synthase subunit HisH [Bacillota bacterium]MBQ3930735.1 imidazole glycerol phosphate synthase subunit HisH [Bacillota bacterium]
MTAIIDYGVGNLFSLACSFGAVGAEAVLTSDPETIKKADRLVLPGVGAFRDAAAKLRESGLWDLVKQQAAKGKPLMGICLGMQLLLDKSLEFGEYEGLGLIPGVVRAMTDIVPAGLKIPQMGWNKLIMTGSSPVFANTPEGTYMYFVHSYYCDAPKEYISAVTEYGAPVTAALHRDNIYGCQFHPEKSGEAGLEVLRCFCKL